jgi:glycerate 2-kinase
LTQTALEAVHNSLSAGDPVRIVAAGKAAVGMAQACEDVLGSQIGSGVMTAPSSGPTGPTARWRVIDGSHPTPSTGSEQAGRAALALAEAARRDRGRLLVCLSGGASAMLAVPADGLTIADKAATTALLLRANLDIGAINTVRRYLSAIKGGQLAARAGSSVTLAISDVCTPVEDDPSVIGSGPTVGTDTSFADALQIVERAQLANRIPASALHHLREGAAGRRAGPVPASDPSLQQASYWLIGSRHDAMRAAAHTARQLGYRVSVVPEPTTGAARLAGPLLIDRARALGQDRPLCLIASGETVVDVTGKGRGGRNQELALGSLEALASVAPAALASLGTDGIDGPTDAAGALVDSDTMALTSAREVQNVLDDNDAYTLLDRLGVLVRRGPTGTNVGDLQVLLLA